MSLYNLFQCDYWYVRFNTKDKFKLASYVALVVKKLPANAGDERDAGLIPGLGRSLGGGHGKALQYSHLENPVDRGAWWATVHGVTKSRTRVSDSHFHFSS